MAPHHCKGCLRTKISTMANNYKETPMEITMNGENGSEAENPCKFFFFIIYRCNNIPMGS